MGPKPEAPFFARLSTSLRLALSRSSLLSVSHGGDRGRRAVPRFLRRRLCRRRDRMSRGGGGVGGAAAAAAAEALLHHFHVRRRRHCSSAVGFVVSSQFWPPCRCLQPQARAPPLNSQPQAEQLPQVPQRAGGEGLVDGAALLHCGHLGIIVGAQLERDAETS